MYRFLRKFSRNQCIVAVAGLAALFAFATSAPSIANNQRAITIHDGSRTITVTTQAATIGDVLKRADIQMGEHDLSEPAQDTPLISPAYTVNVYRARPVTIVDGAIHKHIMSPYHSARSIVSHAEIDLYDEDIVTKQRVDDFLDMSTPGIVVELDRALPLKLVLYGKQTNVRTQATTVQELLAEKDITLGPKDEVSKSLETPLKADMVLDVYRDGAKTETKEEDIDFPTRTIQDADREIGYQEVKTKGVKGKRTVTYQVTLKNGKETARKKIQSVVTKEPKEEVVIVGTKRTESFSGGLADKFAALRQCESGGNYGNKNNPMYRGAYQFGYQTWGNYGGYYDPADAPPAVQDKAALELYQRRGWQPWPACSAKLGL